MGILVLHTAKKLRGSPNMPHDAPIDASAAHPSSTTVEKKSENRERERERERNQNSLANLNRERERENMMPKLINPRIQSKKPCGREEERSTER